MRFTGPVAQMDLNKTGRIDLRFFEGATMIGVEVAGFTAAANYSKMQTTSENRIRMNQLFVERYIDACDNAEELKAAMNIKTTPKQ